MLLCAAESERGIDGPVAQEVEDSLHGVRVTEVYKPTSVCSGGGLSIDVDSRVHLDSSLSTNLCG